MPELDRRAVGDYFESPGTVERWWTPEEGPLSFHYEAELAVLEDQLEIDPDWRVLDVGTGRGRFGVHFASRGCRVVGLDLNPEMLEVARKNAQQNGVADRFEIRSGRAEDLSDFSPGQFDVVSCMELFDHLPDLERALAEMGRVLKPGGHFLFSYVPSESIYGLLGNAYRGLRALFRSKETMISRTYSLREVRARLIATGFELERYWGVGVLCVNAQTRLFTGSPLTRPLIALARAEARRWPYHRHPALARHGAHVVGLAERMPSPAE